MTSKQKQSRPAPAAGEKESVLEVTNQHSTTPLGVVEEVVTVQQGVTSP